MSYSLNAGKLMMPGSTMKIVTAGGRRRAARMGPPLRNEARRHRPDRDGALRGDLFVVGGGDPSISERSDVPGTLRAIARQMRDAGITRIEGGIIGDDDLFDDQRLWRRLDARQPAVRLLAPVSALEYNEGSVDLVIRAGAAAGDPVTIQVRPAGSGLQVDNRLVTVAETGTGTLTLERRPARRASSCRGRFRRRPHRSRARHRSTTRPHFSSSAFRQALMAEGVQVAGDAIDIDELPSRSPT